MRLDTYSYITRVIHKHAKQLYNKFAIPRDHPLYKNSTDYNETVREWVYNYIYTLAINTLKEMKEWKRYKRKVNTYNKYKALASASDEEIKKSCIPTLLIGTGTVVADEQCVQKKKQQQARARRLLPKRERELHELEEMIAQKLDVALNEELKINKIINKFKAVRDAWYVSTIRGKGRDIHTPTDLVPATEETINKIKGGQYVLLTRLAAPVYVKIETTGIIAMDAIGYKTATFTLRQLYPHLALDERQKLDVLQTIYPTLMDKPIHIIKPNYTYETTVKLAKVRLHNNNTKIVYGWQAVKYMRLHNRSKVEIEWWQDEAGRTYYPSGKIIKIPIRRVFAEREGRLHIYVKVPVVTPNGEDVVEKIELLDLHVVFHGHYGKYYAALLKLAKTTVRQLRKVGEHKLAEGLQQRINKITSRNWIAVEFIINKNGEDEYKLISPMVNLLLNARRALARKFKIKSKDFEQMLQSPRVRYWWYLPYKISKQLLVFGNQALVIVRESELRELKKAAKSGKTIKGVTELRATLYGRPLNHTFKFTNPQDVKVLFVWEYNVWIVWGPSEFELESYHHPEYYTIKARVQPGEVLLFIHRHPDRQNDSVRDFLRYFFGAKGL